MNAPAMTAREVRAKQEQQRSGGYGYHGRPCPRGTAKRAAIAEQLGNRRGVVRF